MALAICIKCGETKRQPWAKCSKCGFDPMTDEASLVKSVYLSTGRFEDFEDQQAYEPELLRFSEAIRSGETIDYDPSELERLKRQKEAVETYSPWAPLFRLFLPAILFLGGLALVYAVIRYLRS